MSKREEIDKFLATEKIAIAGVSRKEKFGNEVFKQLKKAEFNVVPVNPFMDEFEGDKCYKDFSEIDNCKAVLIAVKKDKSLELVKNATENNIKNIWFHSGSFTPEALAFCEENNINYIKDECILMYAEPVEGLHSFHRWISKIFGKYQN